MSIPSSADTISQPPPAPTGYTLHDGYPSVPSYLHLRSASGLTPKTTAQARTALSGSWYGCYITTNDDDSTPVAMGRIIGDGGWYFHIADMAWKYHGKKEKGKREEQAHGDGDVGLKGSHPRSRIEWATSCPARVGYDYLLSHCSRTRQIVCLNS
ncbi:hypothetical protein DTO027B9_1048 [Paecilomyces variotii]|nr:hypothetical protein DTO027B9_1048 [Paecilomyces variotii]